MVKSKISDNKDFEITKKIKNENSGYLLINAILQLINKDNIAKDLSTHGLDKVLTIKFYSLIDKEIDSGGYKGSTKDLKHYSFTEIIKSLMLILLEISEEESKSTQKLRSKEYLTGKEVQFINDYNHFSGAERSKLISTSPFIKDAGTILYYESKRSNEDCQILNSVIEDCQKLDFLCQNKIPNKDYQEVSFIKTLKYFVEEIFCTHPTDYEKRSLVKKVKCLIEELFPNWFLATSKPFITILNDHQQPFVDFNKFVQGELMLACKIIQKEFTKQINLLGNDEGVKFFKRHTLEKLKK
jgi:hypothetical protein